MAQEADRKPPAGDLPPRVMVRMELSVLGRKASAEVAVPADPVRPLAMLPLFRSIAEAVIGMMVQAVQDRQLAISCRKGCAACCRKLVPITQTEARRIRDVVDAMPEPQRSAVRRRFAEAAERLAAVGLLERLRQSDRLADDVLTQIGLEYFPHWIACPLLEQECCLIYAERPIACREYMVTSPAAHCFPDSQQATVERVNLPRSVSMALAALDNPGSTGAHGWVPLVLAPAWADSHAEQAPRGTGVELLRGLLQDLAQ